MLFDFGLKVVTSTFIILQLYFHYSHHDRLCSSSYSWFYGRKLKLDKHMNLYGHDSWLVKAVIPLAGTMSNWTCDREYTEVHSALSSRGYSQILLNICVKSSFLSGGILTSFEQCSFPGTWWGKTAVYQSHCSVYPQVVCSKYSQ